MATQNATLPADGSWIKVADAADDPILVQALGPNVIFQVAAVATDTNPTVQGHPLTDRSEGVDRSIGEGYIYARLMHSPINSSEILVVSGSSETLS